MDSHKGPNLNYLANNYYAPQTKPYYTSHSFDFQSGSSLLGTPAPSTLQKSFRPLSHPNSKHHFVSNENNGIFDTNPNFQHFNSNNPPFMNHSPFNSFPTSSSAYSYLNRKSSFNRTLSPSFQNLHENPK